MVTKVRRRRSWIDDLLCDVQDQIRWAAEHDIEWSPDDEDQRRYPPEWFTGWGTLAVDLYGRRLP